MMNKFLLTAFTATILATTSAFAMEPEKPKKSLPIMASLIPLGENEWTLSTQTRTDFYDAPENIVDEYSTKHGPIRQIRFFKTLKGSVKIIGLYFHEGDVDPIFQKNLSLNKISSFDYLYQGSYFSLCNNGENPIEFAAACYSQNLIPSFMLIKHFELADRQAIASRARSMLRSQDIEDLFSPQLNRIDNKIFRNNIFEILLEYFKKNPQAFNSENKNSVTFTSDLILTTWEEFFSRFSNPQELRDAKFNAAQWLSNNEFIDPRLRDTKVKEWRSDVEK